MDSVKRTIIETEVSKLSKEVKDAKKILKEKQDKLNDYIKDQGIVNLILDGSLIESSISQKSGSRERRNGKMM